MCTQWPSVCKQMDADMVKWGQRLISQQAQYNISTEALMALAVWDYLELITSTPLFFVFKSKYEQWRLCYSLFNNINSRWNTVYIESPSSSGESVSAHNGQRRTATQRQKSEEGVADVICLTATNNKKRGSRVPWGWKSSHGTESPACRRSRPCPANETKKSRLVKNRTNWHRKWSLCVVWRNN